MPKIPLGSWRRRTVAEIISDQVSALLKNWELQCGMGEVYHFWIPTLNSSILGFGIRISPHL